MANNLLSFGYIPEELVTDEDEILVDEYGDSFECVERERVKLVVKGTIDSLVTENNDAIVDDYDDEIVFMEYNRPLVFGKPI